jgi:hypothetical protein
VNETAPSSYTRGFSLKITALQVQDNYDGSTSLWAPSADLPDAVQALIIFNFKTSANHQLRFTVSYELYEILFLVSLLNHSTTRSFNITQNVLCATFHLLKDYLSRPDARLRLSNLGHNLRLYR